MAWKIDPVHTSVEFSVKHMMISTVRGQFTKFGGEVTADPNNLLNSKVEGWVDLASVDTHDVNRDNHLRSPDFFDAATHPQMTFASKRIEKVGDNEYNVTGDLTIKGVTREITFNVTSEGQGKTPWGSTVWGLNAQSSLNRKDFGLTWNVGLETGGWLVGDQVKIYAQMELVQVPEQAPEAAAQASAA